MATQILINIDGVTRNASELDFSAVTRKFREAWQFNGDVVEYDVDKMKAPAKRKVRQWFEDNKIQTIIKAGKEFTVDEEFLEELRDAAREAEFAGTDVTVYADDESSVTVTLAQVQDFLKDVSAARNTLRATAKGHAAAIEAATTVAEIEAVMTAIGL